MKLDDAIDAYLNDMRAEGRLTSAESSRAYRDALTVHARDVSNRDPAYTNREDVKATMRHWPNPNTGAQRRSILVSFYDWVVENGYREFNPARQTKRPRKQQTSVYRMTLSEVVNLLAATTTRRERRAVYLMICCGLRNQELRGLQGRHFQRPGFVWVSADIAKGHRERWIPVLADLVPVWTEIATNVPEDQYVIPSQSFWSGRNGAGPGSDGYGPQYRDRPDRPVSSQAVWRLVVRVAEHAGIAAHIHPHLLRHAYADHVARYVGVKHAQTLLGHADLKTTENYIGQPTLDELTDSLEGFTFELPHANVRSREDRNHPKSQEYHHGDSNPGSS